MLSPCVQALIFTGGSSVGRAADCRASRYLLVPGSIPGRRKFFWIYIILYLRNSSFFVIGITQLVGLELSQHLVWLYSYRWVWSGLIYPGVVMMLLKDCFACISASRAAMELIWLPLDAPRCALDAGGLQTDPQQLCQVCGIDIKSIISLFVLGTNSKHNDFTEVKSIKGLWKYVGLTK